MAEGIAEMRVLLIDASHIDSRFVAIAALLHGRRA